MSTDLQLGQNITQDLKLSPAQLVAIDILQKNSLELETTIKAEMEKNPLLEMDESVPDELVSESKDAEQNGDGENTLDADGENFDQAEDNSRKEMEFEDGTLEDSADVDHGLLDGSTESELDWMKSLKDGSNDTDAPFRDLNEPTRDADDVWDRPWKDRDASLQDRLLTQLREWNGTHELLSQLKEAGCSEEKFRSLVEYLIDSLDENGFLQAADEVAMTKVLADNDPFIVEIERVLRNEVALENASLPVVEAIHVLQNFKPRGIGARNLQESFLIQAAALDDFSPLAIEILRDHFDDLMALRYAKIAKDVAVSTEAVQQAVSSLSRLAPHPGQQISATPSMVKVADMRVVEKKGRFEVECFKDVQKRLRINKTYASLLSSKSLSKTDREFIQNNLAKAKELIKNVDNRFTTMELVMRAIVSHQKDFFRKGPAALKPMILQDIATEVKRDLSVVSRVTNGKYVETPFGIFELKQFFTSGVKQGESNDSEVVGSAQILDAIRKLVDEENKKKPLSDQAITDALDAMGIKVARRTVAKYREDTLKILPARLRKKV